MVQLHDALCPRIVASQTAEQEQPVQWRLDFPQIGFVLIGVADDTEMVLSAAGPFLFAPVSAFVHVRKTPIPPIHA